VQSNVSVAGALTAMSLDNYSNRLIFILPAAKNDSSAITRLNSATGSSVWEKTYGTWKNNDIDIDNNGHPLVCGYQALQELMLIFTLLYLIYQQVTLYADYWQDGSATDSVTSPTGHSDMLQKLKPDLQELLRFLALFITPPTAATLYMVKFGSTGNVPTWSYTYDSPTHTEGTELSC